MRRNHAKAQTKNMVPNQTLGKVSNFFLCPNDSRRVQDDQYKAIYILLVIFLL
jgi:hypothetical protein